MPFAPTGLGVPVRSVSCCGQPDDFWGLLSSNPLEIGAGWLLMFCGILRLWYLDSLEFLAAVCGENIDSIFAPLQWMEWDGCSFKGLMLTVIAAESSYYPYQNPLAPINPAPVAAVTDLFAERGSVLS